MKTRGVLKLLFVGIAVSALFAITPAFSDEGKDESGKGREQRHFSPKQHGSNDNRATYFQRHGYTRLNIPAGHYPPPGECRIWFPDRSPGQQPPPGNCNQVPPGAWVIRHPQDNPGNVHVTVYEPQRPGIIHVVGEFEIGSGVFVRVLLDR
jgi:hypothetical protein